MTDWNEVAKELRSAGSGSFEPAAFLAAIELCERMARGELVERDRLQQLSAKWRACDPHDNGGLEACAEELEDALKPT